MTRHNEFGQSIGDAVEGWAPALAPRIERIAGRFCAIERLDPARHGDDLHAAYATAPDARDWTYLSAGPFDDRGAFLAWLEGQARAVSPYHLAVIDEATGRAVGTFALLREDRANGSVEVGWVVFSPLMQRTAISTEAHFLLMRHVFEELGCRRYEWKCDSLNAPSRRAAERLGFRFEGTFRQAVVYKGRTRDTDWFSITDGEWPAIRAGFESWLDAANFDGDGRQLSPLRTR